MEATSSGDICLSRLIVCLHSDTLGAPDDAASRIYRYVVAVVVAVLVVAVVVAAAVLVVVVAIIVAAAAA